MEQDNQKAKVLKASRLLQAKVGVGPNVDEKLIRRSQKLIDGNEVDFAPMAKEHLDKLQKSIDQTRQGKGDPAQILQDMIDPVMQLKANASMFNYGLVGNLANIMLNFLETLETIDNDVIDIAEVHQKTLILIIGNEMKGDGGEYGQQLVTELKEACKRYFAKQASAGNVINDKDAFFIEK